MFERTVQINATSVSLEDLKIALSHDSRIEHPRYADVIIEAKKRVRHDGTRPITKVSMQFDYGDHPESGRVVFCDPKTKT